MPELKGTPSEGPCGGTIKTFYNRSSEKAKFELTIEKLESKCKRPGVEGLANEAEILVTIQDKGKVVERHPVNQGDGPDLYGPVPAGGSVTLECIHFKEKDEPTPSTCTITWIFRWV